MSDHEQTQEQPEEVRGEGPRARGWQRAKTPDEQILDRLDLVVAELSEVSVVVAGLVAVEVKIAHLVEEFLKEWRSLHNKPAKQPAVKAVIVITSKGAQMPGQITVDTTNETVSLAFVDDKGDTDATAPVAASGSPLAATYASSDESVVTVDNDTANPLEGDITVVGEGTADISVELAYEDGTPVQEADGSDFPVPAPVTVTVSAGEAVGASLVLSV